MFFPYKEDVCLCIEFGDINIGGEDGGRILDVGEGMENLSRTWKEDGGRLSRYQDCVKARQVCLGCW